MQWILQRIVGMSGAADWPTIDLDSDSDFSGLEEAKSVEEIKGPSFKRIRLESSLNSDPSFCSFDGIIDWIPEESVSKVLPLADQGIEAKPPQNPSHGHLKSEMSMV